MIRTVAQKMGVRPGSRVALIDDPPGVRDGLALPPVRWVTDATADVDHLQLFVRTVAALDETFPVARGRLAPGGRLWVSWPKGRKLGSDLTLPEVIRIGYSHGLVESTALRVDDVWSALKFTRPRPGTVYRNRYGTLPADIVEALAHG